MAAVSSRAVPTKRLRRCLKYCPGKSSPAPVWATPAAAPAEAVLAVGHTARQRNGRGNQRLPEPGGRWALPDSRVAPDRRPGQGGVSPGLRCGA